MSGPSSTYFPGVVTDKRIGRDHGHMMKDGKIP
jgi:hypothetical protein